MGEEDNFVVDPMNGRIILLVRRIRKNKIVLTKVEIMLEEMEEKIKRREEEESEIDMISNFDFPDFQEEMEKINWEQCLLKDFHKEMEEFKREWRRRFEEIKKQEMKWKWKPSII